MMRSSYLPEDVTILLKDITGLVRPLPAGEREKRIQSGVHYCEMLPLEYKPTEKYMAAYENALDHYSRACAQAAGILAEKIWHRKQGKAVIVSLARAGIPIGILLRRYICRKYKVSIPHYAISIIRGRGIDHNAMRYILEHHSADEIQFVDGWTGKGAIFSQLKKALADYPGVDHSLGVLADPAELTELCGTHEDILIPSSCLNATVTGLISRTFLRSDIIGPDDFHGAAYYKELEKEDLSNEFLETIEGYFDFEDSGSFGSSITADFGNAADRRYGADDMFSKNAGPNTENARYTESGKITDRYTESGKITGGYTENGKETARKIARAYGVEDINFVKPGIGETTRVLLRRVPWKVIVAKQYMDAPEIRHILQLAREKDVPVEISKVAIGHYKTCGIIKKLSYV